MPLARLLIKMVGGGPVVRYPVSGRAPRLLWPVALVDLPTKVRQIVLTLVERPFPGAVFLCN